MCPKFFIVIIIENAPIKYVLSYTYIRSIRIIIGQTYEWCLGQVKESGDTEGVRGGRKSDTAAEGVLEQYDDGNVGGGVLRDRLQGRAGRDTGQPAVTQHFQCGGGCGGPSLGHAGGEGSKNEGGGGGGRAGTRPPSSTQTTA